MGSISLLAASLVVAALGFGWINALKEGVFDFLSFLPFFDRSEEVIEGSDDDKMEELERDDAMKGGDGGVMKDNGEIAVDPEFDDELNALDSELDALLEESESELDSLEGEL
ncbi:MAG: hypothetical protein R3284_12325 [Rubricoccaceae bacterium]|nr:hypothetical protein [Rubricoccaceae bacterium]